jgi:RHS repeat-associated protein
LQYQYDEHGQLTGFTNPLGNSAKLEFDNYGNPVKLSDAQGEVTEFTYDALGRTTTRIDSAKRHVNYQYDLKGRLVKAKLPGGGTITCEYDAEDNLLSYKDENGAVTRLEYCGVNELKRRIQPDGQTVEYEYNAEEQLIAVINQRGERYELKRDAAGRIIEEVDYWGQSRKYSYSAAGYLQESIDPLGRIIRYQTDPLGRIVAKVLPDLEGTTAKQSETFTYDANGNLIACANREIEIKRFFDLEGKPVKEEQGTDCSVAYAYDLNGNRTSRTTTIQKSGATRTRTVNYAYDSLGRATEVAVAGRQPVNFSRNRLGQVIQETLGANLKRWFEYDEAGYLTGQGVAADASPVFRQEYAYDQAGNLVSKSDSVFGTDRFYYNPLGRITRQIDPVGQVRQYLYDQAGDRLITKINTLAPEEQVSEWERTGTVDSQTYRFDRAGNLVERTNQQEKTEFVWDANGRLVKSVSNGQTTIYSYDPLGRRIAKQSGDTTVRFIWDGDVMTGELRLEAQDDGEPVCTRVREWVYYPGSFEPLEMVEADGLAGEADATGVNAANERIYYYANDPNGCPTRLLDENGKVVWAALYDAWGKVKRLPVELVEQPIRLQGQYYDVETGLAYNRWRYYCPEIGAFVSQDPMGLAAGSNVYAFGPSVQGWIDPLGLCKNKPKPITDPSRLLPGPKTIKTPYGDAVQSLSKEALDVKQYVDNGGQLYRGGTFGRSNVTDAQFWAPESPLTPGYAEKYGVDFSQTDYIIGARPVPGAQYITRPAPALGSNGGGAIEVVTDPNTVRLDFFHMP